MPGRDWLLRPRRLRERLPLRPFVVPRDRLVGMMEAPFGHAGHAPAPKTKGAESGGFPRLPLAEPVLRSPRGRSASHARTDGVTIGIRGWTVKRDAERDR